MTSRSGRPRPVNTVLDGFTYDRLGGGAPTEGAKRIAWLDSQRADHLGADFRPQPWEHLIAVLRAMGHTNDARSVAVAKQDRLRRARKIVRGVRLLHALYGIFCRLRLPAGEADRRHRHCLARLCRRLLDGRQSGVVRIDHAFDRARERAAKRGLPYRPRRVSERGIPALPRRPIIGTFVAAGLFRPTCCCRLSALAIKDAMAARSSVDDARESARLVVSRLSRSLYWARDRPRLAVWRRARRDARESRQEGVKAARSTSFQASQPKR